MVGYLFLAGGGLQGFDRYNTLRISVHTLGNRIATFTIRVYGEGFDIWFSLNHISIKSSFPKHP